MTTEMTPMPQATADLAFGGNRAEGMRFYEHALNRKLQARLTNAQSPIAAHIPTEYHHRIL